jgi:hypothetical protein
MGPTRRIKISLSWRSVDSPIMSDNIMGCPLWAGVTCGSKVVTWALEIIAKNNDRPSLAACTVYTAQQKPTTSWAAFYGMA